MPERNGLIACRRGAQGYMIDGRKLLLVISHVADTVIQGERVIPVDDYPLTSP
jgi:hypothetical protein